MGGRIFFHMVSDITDRKQAEERLSASREQLRELSSHLESVREEERTNIAREIHDELGQILAGLKIDLSWLTKRLPKEQELLLEKTKSMYELIDTAVQTVKRISTELRPGALDDLGIAAAIEWQAQEFEKRTEIKVQFKAAPRGYCSGSGPIYGDFPHLSGGTDERRSPCRRNQGKSKLEKGKGQNLIENKR